jgi:hypothetical protein
MANSTTGTRRRGAPRDIGSLSQLHFHPPPPEGFFGGEGHASSPPIGCAMMDIRGVQVLAGEMTFVSKEIEAAMKPRSVLSVL